MFVTRQFFNRSRTDANFTQISFCSLLTQNVDVGLFSLLLLYFWALENIYMTSRAWWEHEQNEVCFVRDFFCMFFLLCCCQKTSHCEKCEGWKIYLFMNINFPSRIWILFSFFFLHIFSFFLVYVGKAWRSFYC